MKRIVTVAIALAVCSVGFADITHQWNFEDGTANDSVGSANGTVSTNGASIAGGALTLSGGQVNFDANEIGVHTYSGVTIEAWAVNSSTNTGWAQVFSIWDQNGGFPNNYLMIQPAREDNVTRGAFQVGTSGSPWLDESGVNGPEVFDVLTQYVLTIDDNFVGLYMDGALIGKAANAEGPLSGLGTGGAALGVSGYLGDPAWWGDVEQLTIYNRALGTGQVNDSFVAGPVAIPEPATIGLIGIFGAGVLFVRRRFMI